VLGDTNIAALLGDLVERLDGDLWAFPDEELVAASESRGMCLLSGVVTVSCFIASWQDGVQMRACDEELENLKTCEVAST